MFGIGQRKGAVGTAAAQNPDQRALPVGMGLFARLAVSLRRAHLIGVDHGEMQSGLVVVDQAEHSDDPFLELLGGTARDVCADAVEPRGQRVGLLAQHRQEQFVLGLEVAVERPRRHPGALQDRGDGDRSAVRLGQAPICSLDDAPAVVAVCGGLGLHVANCRDAARQPGRSWAQIISR